MLEDVAWDGNGNVDGNGDGDLHSEFGVVAISLADAMSLGVTGWRLGLGVPLLPSAITCRIVCSGRWGSQLSSHSPVGVNCVLVVNGCGV